LWSKLNKMNNCLECGKEVTQTAGKRKKEYCGNTCRVKYYLKKKNEGKPKGKRGRPKKLLTIPPKSLIKKGEKATKLLNKFFEKEFPNKPPDKPTIKYAHEENKPTMPKGLSLMQQLEWREKNQK